MGENLNKIQLYIIFSLYETCASSVLEILCVNLLIKNARLKIGPRVLMSCFQIRRHIKIVGALRPSQYYVHKSTLPAAPEFFYFSKFFELLI